MLDTSYYWEWELKYRTLLCTTLLANADNLYSYTGGALMSVVYHRERVRRYEEIGTFWSERGAGKTAADEQRRMEVYTHFI
jgi:hypothetical protein